MGRRFHETREGDWCSPVVSPTRLHKSKAHALVYSRKSFSSLFFFFFFLFFSWRLGPTVQGVIKSASMTDEKVLNTRTSAGTIDCHRRERERERERRACPHQSPRLVPFPSSFLRCFPRRLCVSLVRLPLPAGSVLFPSAGRATVPDSLAVDALQFRKVTRARRNVLSGEFGQVCFIRWWIDAGIHPTHTL